MTESGDSGNSYPWWRFVQKWGQRGQKRETKVILLGDVMLGRTVESVSREKADFTYVFTKVRDRLRSADIVFANLENPIIKNCAPHNSGFIFCANPEMLAALTSANVNIVNLANNHTKNYGERGLVETKEYLEEKGIGYVGYDDFLILESNGYKFGFLGFDRSESAKPMTTTELALVRDSSAKVEVLTVAMHWGQEYQSTGNAAQRVVARDLVAAGADIVVGHHPHWVQDSEEVGGSLVFYSLGNFVFDQMWSEETRKGLAIEVVFKDGKVSSVAELPTYMREWAQPEWVNDPL